MEHSLDMVRPLAVSLRRLLLRDFFAAVIKLLSRD